ncbi:MAG: hypothetical protein Q9167_002244 [Letrouitia subvulpina]
MHEHQTPTRFESAATETYANNDLEGCDELASSVVERPLSNKVPRSKRRGFLGRFSLVAEIEEPKHYPRSTKWFITFVVSLAGATAPLASTVILPSLQQISEEFIAKPIIVNLSIALFMLAMSIGPLWWSFFSETLGRRTIYLTSFTLFILWSALGAVSSNIATYVIMRFLSGGVSSSVQAVGAGTIADIWHVKERGEAMGLFYLGPLCGPMLGPIIGAALAEKWSWRSIQWCLTMYGGVLLIFLIFALPETLKAARPPSGDNSDQKTRHPSSSPRISDVPMHPKRWLELSGRWFVDPLKILWCLRFPAVLVTIYYASITFGVLYVLNISVQTTFSKPPYNFSTMEVGLAYLPSSIGYVLASIFGGRWTDIIMAREARKANRKDETGKLIFRPEDRMRENAWIAAIVYPAALVWYGWTAEKGVHWTVPLIANFFFGVGSMLVFSMAITMLTEFLPKKTSSGVAANNFVRNIFSCIGAFIAEPLMSAIGNGWLFTGLGAIALASCTVIWAMKRFGPRWRETMDREAA